MTDEQIEAYQSKRRGKYGAPVEGYDGKMVEVLSEEKPAGVWWRYADDYVLEYKGKKRT